jgi:hypothetical protein
MPKYLVEWSLQGSSLVEAENEEEAKQKVSNKTDYALHFDVDGFDISDVVLEEAGEGE